MKRNDDIEIDLRIVLVIFAMLIIVLMVGIVFSGYFNSEPVITKETVRVAIIKAENCADCFDIEKVLSDISAAGYNISVREYYDISTSEGKDLASQYLVNRVPTIIVFGDITNLSNHWEPLGVQKDDALVMTKQKPVYIELSSGKIIGRVKQTTILAKGCVQCANLSDFVSELEGAGVVLVNKSVVYDSDASALIKKYNISVLPTVILSSEAQAYDFLVNSWGEAGTFEDDGSLVLRSTDFPYYDMNSRSVRGLVNLTVLKDSSCTNCYDASIHKEILENVQGLSMHISDVSTVDVSSLQGREMVSKYSVTLVPTVIVTGDAALYPMFLQVWPQVGTSEPDGAYVFRKVDSLQSAVYRNLTSNETKSAPSN